MITFSSCLILINNSIAHVYLGIFFSIHLLLMEGHDDFDKMSDSSPMLRPVQ